MGTVKCTCSRHRDRNGAGLGSVMIAWWVPLDVLFLGSMHSSGSSPAFMQTVTRPGPLAIFRAGDQGSAFGSMVYNFSLLTAGQQSFQHHNDSSDNSSGDNTAKTIIHPSWNLPWLADDRPRYNITKQFASERAPLRNGSPNNNRGLRGRSSLRRSLPDIRSKETPFCLRPAASVAWEMHSSGTTQV